MQGIAQVLEACGLTLVDAGDVSRLYHVAEFERRIVAAPMGNNTAAR